MSAASSCKISEAEMGEVLHDHLTETCQIPCVVSLNAEEKKNSCFRFSPAVRYRDKKNIQNIVMTIEHELLGP